MDLALEINSRMCVRVIKKDGSREDFDIKKVIAAIGKSAYRALTQFTTEETEQICRFVVAKVQEMGGSDIPIPIMHNIVESALESVKPIVAKSYRDYRNYKQDFVRMMDDVYKKSQSIMYIGDNENASTDSALVTTKRSLIFNQFSRELYQKFFLTTEEIQACRDGYIYIHDMAARRDTMNCCLFDVATVLAGGFEMGNIWYNEPGSLDVAFDVIGDIVLSAASQQYGGFTVAEVDKILEPYAEKTYEKSLAKYLRLGIKKDSAEAEALTDVEREFEQGFQGWEYKFNTVASSRGDYLFITITAGLARGRFGRMAALALLKVRREGQGKRGQKKAVLFPKIVFLYDEKLHGTGGELEDVFDVGIACAAQTLHPDWLSLSGCGYVADIYKEYGEVISPIGYRTFLNPWYQQGGAEPADSSDTPVYVGRFNIGTVTLHLPMILARARHDCRPFSEVLDYYLDLIRRLHVRTYAYLGEMRASTNPLAYCQGGFLGGHLGGHEKIKPLLASATAGFGITALDELQQLHNGRSLADYGAFVQKTLTYIKQKIAEYEASDGHLYTVCGTADHGLCGLQIRQFCALYGIVEGVSDHESVSGGFDLPIGGDTTQNHEKELLFR